jgi:biopolymer transport protein ExbD
MHGGGSSGSGSKKKARIEIIPLIDVIMFLLATFVLFTLSMQKTQGQSVSLYQAKSALDRDLGKGSVTLSIDLGGELYWNKDKTTWDMFILKLVAYKEECKTKSTDPVIFINFDEGASFGSAMSVLDEIRKAEIPKVNIETKFTAKTASGT